MQKRKFPLRRFFAVLSFGILFLAASALFSVSLWYRMTFDISFTDLLATILSPLEGTGDATIKEILSACLLPVLLLALFYIAFVLLLWRDTPKNARLRRIGAFFCILFFCVSLFHGLFAFRIPEYLKNTFVPSELYETEYVDPASASITDEDGNARNLIYIYLESMETTYASKEAGGAQENANYIPNLTALAESNLSFSDKEKLGGFRSITGTGWTMGALMGSTSGVPFSLADMGRKSHNSKGRDGTFANGLTTLGDILAEKGYNQEFLCGSDGKFAGRSTYFTVHGGAEIFDYYSAIEENYIPQEYYVFWGLEDAILFNIAKNELTALAAKDEPFAFTMLTVDPHHIGGYKCSLCQNEYETGLANVLSCQDRQVMTFLEWCMAQDFYENTTIVIVGDHPRMDKLLIGEELEVTDRTMYNCILNPATEPKGETTNRVFTALDLFPTVLTAMGFEIEGGRLGLGTDLFSDRPTLCEEYGEGLSGYHLLDTLVSRPSKYYKEHFLKKE